MAKRIHIAVIPSPGFSHLVPIVEFTKTLISHHPNIHVTCIIPSLGSTPESSKSYLQTIPSNIHSIFLPPINKQDLPQGVNPGIQVLLSLTLSLPSIHETLKILSSKAPLVALIADYLAFEALDFAKEFNCYSYLFYTSPTMSLSMLFHLPKLDEYVTSSELIKLPGCVPFHVHDLPGMININPSSDDHKFIIERSKKMPTLDGILINSFLEIESGAIRALEEEGIGKVSFYPIGPLTQKGSVNEDDNDECLKWLDTQPQSSVLYVSFGSGGTLSQTQINELALGLELSGQSFLWVLRPPSDSPNDAYLETNNDDPMKYLPSGFLERTKKQGLVVASWAPQIQVLKHSSVGGFLSHCGWNSILESIQEGVPIIAFPLFAEQAMNATMLSDGLKVALRLKFKDDEIVGKEEIAKVVKCLMEGEEGKGMGERMKSLKDFAVKALKDGSSTQALSQLVSHWEKFIGI